MKGTLVIGATSAIGEACLRFVEGPLFLVGRDLPKLEAVARHWRTHEREVEIQQLDLTDGQAVSGFLEGHQVERGLRVVFAAGVLSDEAGEFPEWRDAFLVNTVSQTWLAAKLYEQLQDAGGGHLVMIGSVAGDRGRQSNAIYGAQKAAGETFWDGLRHRAALAGGEVKVSLVKPGFVRSPMTAHLPDGPLFAEPEVVGKTVGKILRGERSRVVYSPGWWRLIMMVVRFVPRWVLHKTKL